MAIHEDFESGNFGHSVPDPGLTPDDSGDSIIPGYRGRIGTAAAYENVAMSRDEALNICIRFGRKYNLPVRKVMCGRGYNLQIAAEWVDGKMAEEETGVPTSGKRAL